MSDIALIWDGARADFGLVRGIITSPEGEHWAAFAGTGEISTPATAALTAATSAQFGFRAELALDDWTPAAAVSILDQHEIGGTSRFYFNLNSGGFLAIGLSEDGGPPSADLPSTAPVVAADGATLWVRADVDTTVGAEVRFYTSENGESWTDLGAPVSLPAGVGGEPDVPLWIGRGRDVGGQLAGKVYRVEVRDGVGDGTIVALFDPSETPAGASEVASDTGETWTLSGAGVAIVVDGDAVIATPAYDLESDEGLQTAVVISLFTDRRSAEGDVLPGLGDDRRGWWGDALPVVAGDQIGSKLWLLAREKQTPHALGRAEQYTREALAWLVEDQVASRVSVTATAPRNGVLQLDVEIQRPKKRPVQYRFARAWAAQGGE